MLVIYPVYMMVVLWTIKLSTPDAEPYKVWPSPGGSMLVNPFAAMDAMVAYSCDQHCDVADSLMQDFSSRTGMDVALVPNTNDFWLQSLADDYVGGVAVAGVEFSSLSLTPTTADDEDVGAR